MLSAILAEKLRAGLGDRLELEMLDGLHRKDRILVAGGVNDFLGEQALITLLAIPLGWLMGDWLSLLATTAMQSDTYRIPFIVNSPTYLLSSEGANGNCRTDLAADDRPIAAAYLHDRTEAIFLTCRKSLKGVRLMILHESGDCRRGRDRFLWSYVAGELRYPRRWRL